MIRTDKSCVSENRLKEAINYPCLISGDDSHMPSVDTREQKEIESILESLTEEGNEIADVHQNLLNF